VHNSDFAAEGSAEATRIAAQAVGTLDDEASSLVKSLKKRHRSWYAPSLYCGSEGFTGRRLRAPLTPPLRRPS
jgi:hypothetical protein